MQLILNSVRIKSFQNNQSKANSNLTQYAYFYFYSNIFENADLGDGKNEEWKKTTRSDTVNSSFTSSGTSKDFFPVLRSAFPRNEIRSFPILLTKVQREEPSQGLFPFCSDLQSKS